MEEDKSTFSKIRALIVDDEEGARDIMQHLLSRIPGIEVTGKAASTEEALAMMTDCMPDLVFLDVQMPEKNGFQLVDYLQKYMLNTHVVFVTAHAEFAINAMKVSAFDYLLKPVLMSELEETIRRFRATRFVQSKAVKEGDLPLKAVRPCKIKFNTRTGYILIAPEEIIFCEADVNYTTLYFGNDLKEVVTMNLGKIEELLAPHAFYRISRSVLINQLYLAKADRLKKQCLLVKGSQRVTLEISTAHIRELEKYIDGRS